MTIEQFECLFILEQCCHTTFDEFVNNFWSDFSQKGGDKFD